MESARGKNGVGVGGWGEEGGAAGEVSQRRMAVLRSVPWLVNNGRMLWVKVSPGTPCNQDQAGQG